MKFIKKYWIGLILVLTPLLYTLQLRGNDDKAKVKNLAVLGEIMNVVQTQGITEESNETLSEYVIQGMLDRLDPHSNFFNVSDFKLMREDQRGSFFGIGATIQQQAEGTTIIAPLRGGPADRAGIRAGDVIKKINGEETEVMTSNQALQKLRGQKNTPVKIEIQRPGYPERLIMTIVRAEIPNNSIYFSFMLDATTGYILIRDFSESTGAEFAKSISTLRRQGMQRLVLDLRGNGGGLLDAAIDVSKELLGPSESIVSIKGRDEVDQETFQTDEDGRLNPFPLVVLINRSSASASEIVAGAVQDHDRGLILGTSSWGKGLVQTVMQVGRQKGLALTTARYYTPSGRSIQRDYEHGWDEYFNPEEETDHAIIQKGPQFKTDLGRTVYGGGGINPDYFIPQEKMTPFIATMRVRHSAFFKFAVIEKERNGFKANQVVDNEMIARFRQWVNTQPTITYTAQDWDANTEGIRRMLAVDLTNVAFTQEEGQKLLLQRDPVIQKTLEVFNEADLLVKRKQLNDQAKILKAS